MSAFMHDAEHLRVIAHAASHFRPSEGQLSAWHDASGRRLCWDTPQAIVTMLAAANGRSIVERYAKHLDDDERALGAIASDADAIALGYTYGRGPADVHWDDREVLQALSSFDYQACEASDYAASEAQAFTNALRYRLTQRYVRTLGDDAQTPWSINRADTSAQTKRTARVRAEHLAARS